MDTIITRGRRVLSSRTGGVVLFIGLFIATAASVSPDILGRLDKHVPPSIPHVPVVTGGSGGVKISGALSNPKIVESETENVYLKISIDTESQGSGEFERKPTDMLVILDHSPSMNESSKMPLAKAAVRDLLSRLTPADRFGLVIFDSGNQVVSDFVPVTPEAREYLSRRVDSIDMNSSGTNIGGGLARAQELLKRSPSERSRRVVLLSDGEANVGVIDPMQLASIAAGFQSSQAVLSSIGMGLQFNEVVMSNLADRGGGNYSYLEHLDRLAEILNKDLLDARRVFASASSLTVQLGDELTITDTGGYPHELLSSGRAMRIQTGQLLSGTSKQFFLTLAPKAAKAGIIEMGELSLSYNHDGRDETALVPAGSLQLAVLEPSRRAEAVTAINAPVFEEAWLNSNFGAAQKGIQQALRSNDLNGAKDVVSSFRAKLSKAERGANISMRKDTVMAELDAAEQTLSGVASSPAAGQAQEMNRLGKHYWSNGKSLQQQVK